jgi:hypothetical protein
VKVRAAAKVDCCLLGGQTDALWAFVRLQFRRHDEFVTDLDNLEVGADDPFTTSTVPPLGWRQQCPIRGSMRKNDRLAVGRPYRTVARAFAQACEKVRLALAPRFWMPRASKLA